MYSDSKICNVNFEKFMNLLKKKKDFVFKNEILLKMVMKNNIMNIITRKFYVILSSYIVVSFHKLDTIEVNGVEKYILCMNFFIEESHVNLLEGGNINTKNFIASPYYNNNFEILVLPPTIGVNKTQEDLNAIKKGIKSKSLEFLSIANYNEYKKSSLFYIIVLTGNEFDFIIKKDVKSKHMQTISNKLVKPIKELYTKDQYKLLGYNYNNYILVKGSEKINEY